MTTTSGSKRKRQSKKQLVFRVPEDLHTRIVDRAQAEDRSMASWIRRALEAQLDRNQT